MFLLLFYGFLILKNLWLYLFKRNDCCDFIKWVISELCFESIDFELVELCIIGKRDFGVCFLVVIVVMIICMDNYVR